MNKNLLMEGADNLSAEAELLSGCNWLIIDRYLAQMGRCLTV